MVLVTGSQANDQVAFQFASGVGGGSREYGRF
jgi:hypothetical protein